MAPGGLRLGTRSGAPKSAHNSQRVVGSYPLNANISNDTNTAIAPGGLRSIVNQVMAKSQRVPSSRHIPQRVLESQHMTDTHSVSPQRVTRSHAVSPQRVTHETRSHAVSPQRVTRSHAVSPQRVSAVSPQRVTRSHAVSPQRVTRSHAVSENVGANTANDAQVAVPNTANEINTDYTEVRSEGKKVRKKAQNKALNDFIDGGGGKPKIEIPIGKKRPLGKWSDEWVSEMGIIVRQNIPLTFHSWKELKDEHKIPLYKKITSKFDVDISREHVREAVESSLKDRFKDRRHKIHLYYLSIPEGLNKLEHPEKTVTQLEWESLCEHFESEKFKRCCERNKKNRERPRVNHRGGRKSFVCHRFDQRDPETGEEPDVVEFYRKMRWNEKKGWIAPQAEENYTKMVEIRSQSIEEGDKELADTEILERVLGKRSGYVMGLGHGEVPPSRKSRVAHNEEELYQLRSRTIEQDQELNELRAWKASQEELSQSQQQMIEAQAKKQEETDRLLNALKQKFGL